jgi:hypothetical protein
LHLDANGPLLSGSFAALRAGDVAGILVQNVFTQDQCTKIVAGLESNAPGFE